MMGSGQDGGSEDAEEISEVSWATLDLEIELGWA